MAVDAVEAAWERAFLRNAQESRECGYDLLCAICGAGLADDSDLHDEMAHTLYEAKGAA